jgi:hypothetical protein
MDADHVDAHYQSVKSNVVAEGHFPEGFWESADEIDWNFVRQFARTS